MSLQKIVLGLLWIGVLGYGFTFAPPNQPDTMDLIINLSTGKWQGINPLVIALFNLMGVLPIAYSVLLLIDGRNQKLPAWLFSLASFGVGAFAILPYLILRAPAPQFMGEKNWFLTILDSRLMGIAISLGAIALLGFGVSQGDWSDFVAQWQTNRFIHVMSLDFLLLCSIFPVLLWDDLQRRKVENQTIFWLFSLIPFFGLFAYLIWHPPLKDPTLIPSN